MAITCFMRDALDPFKRELLKTCASFIEAVDAAFQRAALALGNA